MNDALEQTIPRVLGVLLAASLIVFAASSPRVAVSANALGAPSTDRTVTDRTGEPSMKQFVLIFRQRPGELTAEEVARRNTDTHAWALTQNAAGHALDARILTAESERVAPERARSAATGELQTTEVPVTAILFLEARDLAEAVSVARAHPGRRFGASVEVRPWAVPPAQAAARP